MNIDILERRKYCEIKSVLVVGNCLLLFICYCPLRLRSLKEGDETEHLALIL